MVHICHAGWQVALWDIKDDSHSNVNSVVFCVPRRYVPSRTADFVPCDQVVQRAHQCERAYTFDICSCRSVKSRATNQQLHYPFPWPPSLVIRYLVLLLVQVFGHCKLPLEALLDTCFYKMEVNLFATSHDRLNEWELKTRKYMLVTGATTQIVQKKHCNS